MNEKLEQAIYAIDPLFFRQKDLPMTQTCMCWGIECDDGWYKPIARFVEQVSLLNKILAPYNRCIVASQIKSKWADFTCYWNVEVLDENVEIDISEENYKKIRLITKMMSALESACKDECSHTCEICGYHSCFNNDLCVCGSWLTVKCHECAQKPQRETGRITDFSKGFEFLSPLVKETVVVDGKRYCTPVGAYYGTLYPEHREFFASIDNPATIQNIANEFGLCKDDDTAVNAMKKVIQARYSNKELQSALKSTKDLEIINMNNCHENKWGVCCCPKCNAKGENIYGKLLMEFRSSIDE